MLKVLRNTSPAHSDSWDWEELRRSALATSLQVLRSRQDAEDAAQEAILRAWRARARCHGAESPYPWVGRIARNEALRLGARLGKRNRTEGEALTDADEQAIEGTTTAEEASWRNVVVAALRELPTRDAEMVRLRYVEDLQYSTIAERLGLPLGTVKIRLHRLHTRLRKVATNEGISRDL